MPALCTGLGLPCHAFHSLPHSHPPLPLDTPHRRYRAFLDSVTPAEWFETLAANRAGKKETMRQAWEAQCASLAAHRAEALAAKQRAEHDMQWARTQQQFERAERAQREAAAVLREALATQVGCGPE